MVYLDRVKAVNKGISRMTFYVDLLAMRAIALLSRYMPVRIARAVVNGGLLMALFGGGLLIRALFTP